VTIFECKSRVAGSRLDQLRHGEAPRRDDAEIEFEGFAMITITLPDGSHKQFDNAPTVQDVASSIGAGLAKAALAGKVDGKLVDTSFKIDRDAKIEIVTEKSPDALDIIRHSTAHLLAQATQRLFPIRK